MKKQIIDVIEANKDAIIACGEYILNNPELGFKEYKTRFDAAIAEINAD